MAAAGDGFSSQSPGRHRASSVICLFLLLSIITASSAGGQSLPGCPTKCGDVEVPYPFGLSSNCSRDETFLLTCNSTSGGTSRPRLFTQDGFRVFNISISQGYIDASLFFVTDCYDKQGTSFLRASDSTYKVSVSSPFSISSDRNRFVVTGCDVYFWYWNNFQMNQFWTGCLSGCEDLTGVVNETCSGFGCCESNMPKNLRTLEIQLQSFYNHSKVFDFNPCSYAFIVNRDKFEFDRTWITADYRRQTPPQMSAVLDWSIKGAGCGKANISAAGNGTSAYACASANSECVASPNGLGYLCNCSAGYSGNPYLQGGCEDIDECQLDRQRYPCDGHCRNTQGSYSCSCPAGTFSDDPKKFKCISIRSGLPLASKLIIGIVSGTLCFSLIIFGFYIIFHKRQMQELRERFFQKNGGIFLEQILLSQKSSFKIFSLVDVQKATRNFSTDSILGHGSFGTVYKGILDGGHVVEVKKSFMIDENRNQEFAKELFVLSKIQHKNVVKLLGCCLESEAPILIYEYIPNGTLFDYIQKKGHNLRIPFATRIKFAIQSGEALRHLHAEASPPVLHGDVKSSNILLDENGDAKISDFGTSVLEQKLMAESTTFVQGTCGYLDPEYMKTNQRSDKTDVYNFGVILVELLTGRKPFALEKIEEQNLAFTFVSKMNQSRLLDMLDEDIVGEGESKEVMGVAELAIRCLCLSIEERPSMKDVVTVLENLYA